MEWTRSSACKADQPMCTEVTHELVTGRIYVRNSQRPDDQVWFDAEEWTAFLAGAKAGEFDLPA